MPKFLPTSTSTFADIINGGFVYIDKTKYVYELVQQPKGAWFLSRPRRFGKSLFVSTLEELFRGNRDLFEGLWINSSDYEWEEYAVIRFDFNLAPQYNATELEFNLKYYLSLNADNYDVELPDGPSSIQFIHLIRTLSKERQVVILIDEYDKPLIDNLDNLEAANEILRSLKGFYGVIKAMDRHIRMSFITGITKFSKVGIFSDLNNLSDLTLHSDYATVCGFTEGEIRHYLAEHIELFTKKHSTPSEEFLSKMRYWYNGFCFAGDGENVYNPYSTIHLFFNQKFSNYWFETGSPSFLIRLILNGDYSVEELSNQRLGELYLSSFEIGRLQLMPLLFQTGYMTIKEYYPDSQRYLLGYPNWEVENAFMVHLLDAFSQKNDGLSEANLWQMIDALRVNDLNEFFMVLQSLFANIDYDLHLGFEKYYQSMFYLIFQLMGLRISAEVKTNVGRIDAVVEVDERIYIFEFKIDKSPQDALAQIKDRTYYQKYQQRNKPITCVGANFSTDKRNIDGWAVAESDQLQP